VTETADGIVQSLDDSVLMIRLDREAKKNAINLAMWRALAVAVQAAQHDDAVRAIILTGGTSCFSAGADISEFATVRSTPEQAAEYEEAVDGAMSAVQMSAKPVIAAVSGVCMAGALGLAASADFRVADRSATFAVTAVRMGLVYNIAKCARLYQLVGLTNAKRILMTGECLAAEDALRIGLVDEVVDDPLVGARSLAAAMAAGAPVALEGLKAILEALASGNIEACRPALERRIAAADASEDHREATRAFAEKRKPVFTGR
jgi:enoyl-CoA hydratase/carnithine racemase